VQAILGLQHQDTNHTKHTIGHQGHSQYSADVSTVVMETMRRDASGISPSQQPVRVVHRPCATASSASSAGMQLAEVIA